nr:ATP synthase F0 subunit 8 [Geosesarma faustum]
MPQMAPLYWLYLFIFFLLMLLLFVMLNYYIKPFNNITLTSINNKIFSKHWKL